MGPSETGADLRVDPALLRELAVQATTLVDRLDTTQRTLRAEADDPLRALDGLASATALRRVRDSWAERLTTVQQRCDGLAAGLTSAAADFDATEEDARQSMERATQLPDWTQPQQEGAR
ncbi:WXG100 family type VII secretion target [Streptomyces millisiae]|uniref:Type VII secretion target n=1 Tax=Streptomyces millisiae TaxID=3075542 RepID=A0ABU2LVC5_9ACTN|nr:type VII secretion target [Streptomyces sp. DSM 44918]MDT0321544.1 type VII secretion target [Streptomyces sp. DSM 44918]